MMLKFSFFFYIYFDIKFEVPETCNVENVFNFQGSDRLCMLVELSM